MIRKWHLLSPAPLPACRNVDHGSIFLKGVFRHVYYAILVKYKSWLYASVSNLTFKYTALLLVIPVKQSPYVPLEMVFVDKYTIAHGILIVLWLLAECFKKKKSAKIRNSVDNNLLLKIRFRQNSVTFFAVDISRTFWPKRRLHNWYGNTNRGIRKTGIADHLFTEF